MERNLVRKTTYDYRLIDENTLHYFLTVSNDKSVRNVWYVNLTIKLRRAMKSEIGIDFSSRFNCSQINIGFSFLIEDRISISVI